MALFALKSSNIFALKMRQILRQTYFALKGEKAKMSSAESISNANRSYMATSAITIWTTIISGNYLEFRISQLLQILIKMYSLYVLIINVFNFHFFYKYFSTSNSLLLVIRLIKFYKMWQNVFCIGSTSSYVKFLINNNELLQRTAYEKSA